MGYVWDVPTGCEPAGMELGLEKRRESFVIHAAFDPGGHELGALARQWEDHPHPELPLEMLDGLIVGLLQLRRGAELRVNPDGFPLADALVDGVAFLLDHAAEKLDEGEVDRVYDVLSIRWEERMGDHA